MPHSMPFGHFLGVVLEALERADLALEDLLFARITLTSASAADHAIQNPAAGDGADLGDLKTLMTSALPT